jgi:hypothetical protein
MVNRSWKSRVMRPELRSRRRRIDKMNELFPLLYCQLCTRTLSLCSGQYIPSRPPTYPDLFPGPNYEVDIVKNAWAISTIE